MSLETEAVLDRRRLKRSTSLWRGAAIAAIALAVGAFAFSGGSGLSLSEEHQIARVTIEGMITEDREQLRMLKRIAEAKHVDGVILFVNSPGGTTTGGEALFEALRKISDAKPIVSQFGTVAASAGYIVGLGTDYIVARGNSITGSVGVIMQWPEVSELMAKVGIKMNEIKSGPLKATPSMFQPLDDPGRSLTEKMIKEGQQWFLGLVTTRRGVVTALTLSWARALGEFGPVLVFSGATRMRTEVLPTSVFLELSVGNLYGAVAVSLLMVAAALVVLVVVRVFGSGRAGV